MGSQMCIVNYRVSRNDFSAAVRFYCAVVGRNSPDYNDGSQARIVVFAVPYFGHNYSCELRVSVVPGGHGGGHKSQPVVYWGTDDVENDFKELLKKLVKKPHPDTMTKACAPTPSNSCTSVSKPTPTGR